MVTLARTAALASRWGLVVIGAVLLWRLYGLTWRFASNVPFSDQWALWEVLFDGFQWSDFWHAYQYQHGPHRQGLSFALMLPVYVWSDWNIRLEALLIASIQVLSGWLALLLRRRLLPAPYGLWDAVLLAGFWGVLSYETIYVTPNASHSIAPLALLLLWVHLWLAPAHAARTAVLLVLTHALCFTGFGITAMPALLAVLALQAWRAPPGQRRREWVLLAGALLSLVHFAQGYVFNPAVANFDSAQTSPLDHGRFLIALLHYFFQSRLAGVPVGWHTQGILFLLTLLLLGLWALRGSALYGGHKVGDDVRIWPVVLLLVGVTLTFAVLTSYGRALLGVQAAYASRYMVLLLPGFLALYLVAYRLRARTLLPLFVLALLMGTRHNQEYRRAWDSSDMFASVKACWFETYRTTGDHALASERVDRAFPPLGFKPNWMGNRYEWQHLKEHRLGPYSAFSQRLGAYQDRRAACPP